MVVLPWDVLWYIGAWCDLPSRYRLSVTCTAFRWRPEDWRAYCRQYTIEDSRPLLRRLIRRDYSEQWRLIRQNARVWSVHRGEPLSVWTPFTRLTRLKGNSALLYFAEYRFLNFVRYVARRLKLRTLHVLRRLGRQMMAVVPVWDMKQTAASIVSRGRVRRRRTTRHYFESASFPRVRALVDFRLARGALRPHVLEVQFLTE